MTIFDKFCAVLAVVLGGLPALIGWGIVRCVWIWWRPPSQRIAHDPWTNEKIGGWA